MRYSRLLVLIVLLASLGRAQTVEAPVEEYRLLRHTIGRKEFGEAIARCKELIGRYPSYMPLYATIGEVHQYADLVLEIEKGKRSKADQEAIDAKTRADKAGLPGSVMISDAFFPFRDGADVGVRQGVSAILQAGGSARDFETIEACNEANPQVAMKYTGQRSFKH